MDFAPAPPPENRISQKVIDEFMDSLSPPILAKTFMNHLTYLVATTEQETF